MKSYKKKPVAFRRKREGKTNYHKKLKTLSGRKIRLVVRPSLKGLTIQLISFQSGGDKVIYGMDISALKKLGWKGDGGNVSAAYLLGYLLGKKMVKKIPEAILDTGLFSLTKGNRVYACLKGVLDAGLNIPHSAEILPPEDRLSGKHIEEYANKLKTEDAQKFEKIFASYIKSGLDPAHFSKHFKEIKEKIAKL